MAIECTASNLVDLSKCFCGLSAQQRQMIEVYLLCQIADAGGGGVGEVLTGAFDDPNGNVTPSDTTAAAIYYKDHATQVNQWRWSVADQVWYQNMGP